MLRRCNECENFYKKRLKMDFSSCMYCGDESLEEHFKRCVTIGVYSNERLGFLNVVGGSQPLKITNAIKKYTPSSRMKVIDVVREGFSIESSIEIVKINGKTYHANFLNDILVLCLDKDLEWVAIPRKEFLSYYKDGTEKFKLNQIYGGSF